MAMPRILSIITSLALLLLLFFPSAIVGYTSEGWDWVIGFGNCEAECNTHGNRKGWTCGKKQRTDFHCSCWSCQRDCKLSEAAVSLDHCASAQAQVERVQLDVYAYLTDLEAELAINLIGAIPDYGPFASAGLNYAKGIFEMGEEEALLTNIIDDVNQRLDGMNKCLGQQIQMVQVEDQMDSMERAFILFDHARLHEGNANDDLMDKLRAAWDEHVLVAQSEFNNVARSADYFSKLLLPMQDFAQSFVLASADYLMYLHELDEANYKSAFQGTIRAFGQLGTWANTARSVIKLSISNKMHTKPCRNGGQVLIEMNDWNAKFVSTNISPIDAYMDELNNLNRVLISKNGWFKGDMGSTCVKTCKSMGMSCDADKQSTITSANAIKNAFSDAGYDCKSFGDKPRNYAGTPFSTGRGNDDCYWLTPGAKSVCNANQVSHHYPLCSCKPAVQGWYRGTAGATCDKTCKSMGMKCWANKQRIINSQSAMKNAFSDAGYDCKSFGGSRDYPGTPFSTGRGNDDCYWLTPGAVSVCSANKEPNHHPLCYCTHNVGWYKGAKGATCDDTCQSKGLACDANRQSGITSESAIKYGFAEAGYDCKSFGDKPRNYAGTPFSTGRDNDDCYWLTSGAKSVCNAINSANQSPLCYCTFS